MRLGILIGCFLLPVTAFAQGEDGTRPERNAEIIAQMLPGRYDNANQAYFDRRLKLPEADAHGRMSIAVTPRSGSAMAFDFAITQGEQTSSERIMLAPDNAASAVRFKRYRGKKYLKNCDLLAKEEAGQFRAVPDTAGQCSADLAVAAVMLSDDGLWVDLAGDGRDPYALEKARDFACYVDVPGVGGGRDIPYRRYEIPDIHDKGGRAWISLDDGSDISITLQNIRWPMNNLKGIFTRHSFVMYVGKREKDEEEAKEVSYAWTEPTAQRIGMNLKWMLVNCYMLSNEEVQPYFKKEPRL